MRWIFAAAEFIRTFRRQLRFGDRSRLPLKLVRLELREGYAECEWIAIRGMWMSRRLFANKTKPGRPYETPSACAKFFLPRSRSSKSPC